MDNNDYTQDRKDAVECVQNAALALVYYGTEDFTKGWDAATIGRQTKERNISMEDMSATELVKAYHVLQGLQGLVDDLLNQVHYLATVTAFCENQKQGE